MAKYVYPAIFTKEENGFSIRFPDLDGCFTEGDTIAEGLEMAKDALCLMLYDKEECGDVIPTASQLSDIKVEAEEFKTLIMCDTLEYRKFFDSKAVKKTLTIPNWLNNMAERQGINFSMTLQNALKQQLNIE